jgi:hypothetical protein
VLRSAVYLGLALAVSSAGLLGLGTVAVASDHTHTAYAEWTVSDGSGTVEVPDSDFPAGTYTSDSTPLRVATGKSTFLNTTTPVGAEFGSSRDQAYLVFGTASHNRPSTTTITFGSGTPTKDWGFVLGDIDADRAQITAKEPDGTSLTAGELGWQGAFNYCLGSPKPSACAKGTTSDKPTWDPATSTLIGSGTDTDGASGWFSPTKPVKELTIVFSVQTGIPIGQLWIASKWQRPPITSEPLPITEVVTEVVTEPVDPPGVPDNISVVISDPGTPDPHAHVCDDLRRVLNGAKYDNDAHATGGALTYHDRSLCWEGPVTHRRPATIDLSVTPDGRVPQLVNVVYGFGPREACHHGCFTTITVLGRNLCRAAVSGVALGPGRPASRTC